LLGAAFPITIGGSMPHGAIARVATARLVGRRPEPGDADAYVRFYGDPRTPEAQPPRPDPSVR
jgi:hypothetical protein